MEEISKMTCKDCLHFEVCEAIRGRSNRVGRNSLRVSEKHCPYNSFKDKSEWIYLPYKVEGNRKRNCRVENNGNCFRTQL